MTIGVNENTFKILAFEQVFATAATDAAAQRESDFMPDVFSESEKEAFNSLVDG